MRKGLEKLMATRMAYMVEKHNLLRGWQIDGIANRSAVHAIIYLTSLVDRAKRDSLVLSTLCKGVKQAFEKLLHSWLSKT